ncbi:immunity 50 family protein [Pseudomonas sp. B21-015]|uniref:immunity 50 family protein n=1 Tax=Pseudomonas sp. B21-015 TaxID=2895473 RepID=UPI00216058B5|nr:immunity 50 family protein [Pseudomonas sp. B21-015]UVM52596.1 immunity 50 family protein [Pseudomonas sp. B21-015]
MWTSSIPNKKQWTSIFGEDYSPTSMHTSYVMLDGNSICLKLCSQVEPAVAPKKWLEKNYYEYEFQLYIINVENFNVENFNFSGPTTITVTQDGSNYKVTLGFGNSCTATCNAKNITIANIKAYHNDGAV